MVLNRESKLVLFTYVLNSPFKWRKAPEGVGREDFFEGWGEYSRVPFQTTLCAFFWRAFVFMPLAVLLAVFAVIGGVGLVGYVVYKHTLVLTYVLMLLGAVVLAVWEGRRFYQSSKFNDLDYAINKKFNKVADKLVVYSGPLQVFWAGLKALKAKVCPIIELK